MKAKRIPPGWTETGRKSGGGYEPCSQGDYTTRRTELQELILSFLHSGMEHAVTLRDIRNASGFDGRKIRIAFREARLRGVPLVSDCQHGYWLSEIPAEIRACASGLRHRARETVLAADALDATADALEAVKAVAI